MYKHNKCLSGKTSTELSLKISIDSEIKNIFWPIKQHLTTPDKKRNFSNLCDNIFIIIINNNHHLHYNTITLLIII